LSYPTGKSVVVICRKKVLPGAIPGPRRRIREARNMTFSCKVKFEWGHLT